MNLPVVARRLSNTVVKKSPTILTCLGVVGLVSTVGFAIVAAPKAKLIIDDLYGECPSGEKVSKFEIVKAVLPVYIPTIAMGGVTIACIIGAARISSRRNTVLAGLYSASELALSEYQKQVVKRLGSKEAQAVKDEVAAEKVRQNPVSSNQVFITGGGETLCFDSQSGRYFKSDVEKIRRIENTVNHDIVSNMELWVPLNDFYYRIGLDDIVLGHDVGWDLDHHLAIDFSATIAEDGRPCIVLAYKVVPRALPF